MAPIYWPPCALRTTLAFVSALLLCEPLFAHRAGPDCLLGPYAIGWPGRCCSESTGAERCTEVAGRFRFGGLGALQSLSYGRLVVCGLRGQLPPPLAFECFWAF